MVSNIHDATFSSNTFFFFVVVVFFCFVFFLTFFSPHRSRVCCFIVLWSVLQCFQSCSGNSPWGPLNSRCRLTLYSVFCWGWFSTFMLRCSCMPSTLRDFSHSTFSIQNRIIWNFSFNAFRMNRFKLLLISIISYNHRKGNRHTQAHRATTLSPICFICCLIFTFKSLCPCLFVSLTGLNRKKHANRKVRNCIKSAKMYSFKKRYSSRQKMLSTETLVR